MSAAVQAASSVHTTAPCAEKVPKVGPPKKQVTGTKAKVAPSAGGDVDATAIGITKLAHKRLTASIHGMSVGTERRFLNAIRQFGYGIKPDTRILKDGSAATFAAEDGADNCDSATAGEFALKYLIGQSIKRRRKMLLRKGTSPSEVDAMVPADVLPEVAAPEKLDLRSSVTQKRESAKQKKEVATAESSATADATKKRTAPKRKTPPAADADEGKATAKADDDAAPQPKRKRVKHAADGANAHVARNENTAEKFKTPVKK